MNSAPARIAAFLREHPDEMWCADCLSGRVQILSTLATNISLAIEGYRHFSRCHATCSGCGERGSGLRYDMPPPGVEVAGLLCAVCGDGIETADELAIIQDAGM